MNEQHILKVRQKLIKAIDTILGDAEMEKLNCWYGEHHAEYMAEAALAVLLATEEAQEFMKANNQEPI